MTALSVLLQTGVGTDTVVSAVFVFFVSLVIGAVAITLGAQVVIDRDTGFRRATVTALVGAVAYTLVGVYFGWIPLLGPLLMLGAWIGVINWQYPGGWGTALGLAAVAWLNALLILYGLTQIGLVTPEVVGLPLV